MEYVVKISVTENGPGISLSHEVLTELGAKIGDTITLAKTRDGLVLTSLTPQAYRQLEIDREVVRLRRNVLHELGRR